MKRNCDWVPCRKVLPLRHSAASGAMVHCGLAPSEADSRTWCHKVLLPGTQCTSTKILKRLGNGHQDHIPRETWETDTWNFRWGKGTEETQGAEDART